MFQQIVTIETATHDAMVIDKASMVSGAIEASTVSTDYKVIQSVIVGQQRGVSRGKGPCVHDPLDLRIREQSLNAHDMVFVVVVSNGRVPLNCSRNVSETTRSFACFQRLSMRHIGDWNICGRSWYRILQYRSDLLYAVLYVQYTSIITAGRKR